MINKSTSLQYSLVQKISFERNFKSNMYFKQNFFRLTKFQRKIPSRRKHLHN